MSKKDRPKTVWGKTGTGLWLFAVLVLCAGGPLLGGCPLADDPDAPLYEDEPPADSGTQDPADNTAGLGEQSGSDTPEDTGGSDGGDGPADTASPTDPANPPDSAGPEDPKESADPVDPAGLTDSADPEAPKEPADPADSDVPEEPADPEDPEAPEESGESDDGSKAAGLILRIVRPAEGEISVEGLPSGPIRLSQTGAGDQPRELRFRIAGFVQTACWVDGTEIAPRDGEYVVRAADYPLSRHFITCMGISDGVPYGREIPFIVTE